MRDGTHLVADLMSLNYLASISSLDYVAIIYLETDAMMGPPRIYIQCFTNTNNTIENFIGSASYNIVNNIIRWDLPRFTTSVIIPEEFKKRCEIFFKLTAFW